MLANTLTKAELVDRLCEDKHMEKHDATALVDSLFEEIKTALEQGHKLKIAEFGNFDLRDKRERPGRNPKTGEEKIIEARRVVTFKAGQKAKATVEEMINTADQEAS